MKITTRRWDKYAPASPSGGDLVIITGGFEDRCINDCCTEVATGECPSRCG